MMRIAAGLPEKIREKNSKGVHGVHGEIGGKIHKFKDSFKTLADLPVLVFAFDVRFKKPAVRGRRQKILINDFRNAFVLVNGTYDKFDLEHIAFMFVPDPFDFAR